MALKDPKRVQDDEVYVLTPRGEQELRGSETAVSPVEIELLVQIDGVSTVARIAAETRQFPPNVVRAAFQKLLDNRFITRDLGTRASDDLSIVFDETPSARPSRKAMSAATAEAATGISSLKNQGFYARIARRSTAGVRPRIGKRLRAIIVEDEPHLAKFLVQYLAFEGFDTQIAGNREQIVTELRRPPLPDLVLLDVILPDADGFDILFKMRQHPALKVVPVIMMTAKATRGAVLKGLAGGADGYVTKPFEAEALIKAVRAVVGLPADGDQDTQNLIR